MHVSHKMNISSKSLTFVIPCYNEQEALPETIKELVDIKNKLLQKSLINEKSKILLIDDGSSDKTWEIIEEGHIKDSTILGIKLSKNFGHQNALLAGLLNVDTDFCISLDADLQDDLNIIEEMIIKYSNGAEIVYAKRSSRKTDSFLKRVTAELYYKTLRKIGINIVENHADFRLMSKRSVKILAEFKESNLFLRGIVPQIGLRTEVVEYVRKSRNAGISKYNISKMFSLALNGITSFSAAPLHIIFVIGAIISSSSILMAIWALMVKLFSDNTVPGWASTVIPIYFIGGIQLLSIGVLGIYISKIFDETKKRPRFIIEKFTNQVENE